MDAIDARTGNVIWRYQRPPASTAAYRGTSVYDNKVFIATTDAHLVALDARSGGVVWDAPGFPPAVWVCRARYPGWRRRARSLSACWTQLDGYIQAYDAATGKYLWTWHAIPKIGEPESKTWSDNQKEGGGAIWMSGSFDPEQNC